MRVFVLGTGRCGTVTCSRACSHLTNYTVGHETRAGKVGDGRFDYPGEHIEIDPRLPWFTGELASRFPDAFYLHLVRDPEATAQSIARRWGGRGGFARGFGESMILRGDRSATRLEIARFQVRTMTLNIGLLLGCVEHRMAGSLEDAKSWFPEFVRRIGGQGDIDRALSEWEVPYNASRGEA